MGHIMTNDGVKLRYQEAGCGKPLVLIPGWSQTAEQFKHQLEGLSGRYRVIALDMRGHGDSDKPEYGYRISRLAKDVHDALRGLELEDVTLLGHSMGCSVIWCYFDLFGSERLSKLILVDQMPLITANPGWSEQERIDAGSIFDLDSLYAAVNGLVGPDGVATTRNFIGAMFTAAMPQEEKTWVIERNLLLARQHAATLLYNHATQDWRDVIRRIDLPTLIVGGRVSLVPWRSQEWIQRQIPGARLEIFEEHEGGQHFMFMENPEKFNQIVAEFID